MYSVNGVALDNPTFGWKLRAPTKPLPEIARLTKTLNVPGRHGVVSLPWTFSAPALVFVVETPKANLESLYALFSQETVNITLTAVPSRVATVELLSSDLVGYGDADAIVDATFTVRLTGAFLRASTDATSAAAAISAASVAVSVLSGLSAPVADAIVRVKGSITGLRITDAGGSWFEYPANVPSGSYLRFHADSGQAFVTTSDTWTGGTEVSGGVDFNGPRQTFEITPKFTDPSARAGGLTVTSTARSGATVEVRGKAAYLV